MREITCAHCGNAALRRTGEVNRSAKIGAPLYCSIACSGAAKTAKKKPTLGWHERRFDARPGTIEKQCETCATPMWLPPSKAGEYKNCGRDCARAARAESVNCRVRTCQTCAAVFTPRGTQLARGHGKFCSQKCNTAGRAALQTEDAYAARLVGIKTARSEGRWRVLSGSLNQNWKGGEDARKARLRDSGKQAAALRRYRRENPHKVREFSMRRRGRKLGRLEYGSIPRIGEMQRWKCAICRVSIKSCYHVDHITPLAKGGEHRARNIQLLCGKCNVRKSAKDPMSYMREIGRLL